jgi:hypothetical protein
VGADQVKDFYRMGGKDGTWISLWPMPFESDAILTITNYGKETMKVAMGVEYAPWEWDERSMHFHACWRFDHPIPTQPRQDWNYVEIKGKGVFVGDNLAVINPSEIWWGEGDEKIYFDGQTFPSHFGTGTEDYYGYAWCSPEPFLAPFHGQPRCDGYKMGNNWGHTTISRVRALDAIPFQTDFRFDMEVWHWRECEVGYGATSFFYARPGVEHNRAPLPAVAAAPVPEPAPLPPPYRIEGAIECEEMEILDHSEGMPVGPQKMRGYGKQTASNDLQLWCQGRQPGDFVELKIPAPSDGKYRVTLYAIRSWDYGIMRFQVNGKDTGKEVDLFNTAGKAVAPTGAIDLGVFEAEGGSMTLRAEVVGGHPDSEGSKSFFGLDCVVLEPAS